MPNILKIHLPANANAERVMKQVQEARDAMRRRVFSFVPAVMTRNVGMAANGSTRKKTELMATIENSAIDVRNERAASCGIIMRYL